MKPGMETTVKTMNEVASQLRAAGNPNHAVVVETAAHILLLKQSQHRSMCTLVETLTYILEDIVAACIADGAVESLFAETRKMIAKARMAVAEPRGALQ